MSPKGSATALAPIPPLRISEESTPRLAAGSGGGDVAARAAQRAFEVGALELTHQFAPEGPEREPFP
jgi:hypothetical protein